jgi:site-specific recombinase XerD
VTASNKRLKYGRMAVRPYLFLSWKRQNKESCAKRTPLFVSQKGGHLTRQALFEIVKRIFRDASIEQSPHCLRKTGATLYYIESDYDLIATQHFLGHADPSCL